MFSVQPLEPRHLPATTALVARCFPTDVGYRWALPLCAMPDALADVRRAADLVIARQWVATDANDAVAGTAGLFATSDDVRPENGFIALNWFCIEPGFRGSGLGRRIWEMARREATALGARRLIFYSSTEAHHMRAERLYLAAGCARRVGALLPDGVHRLTYFDLSLGDTPAADAATAARIDASLEKLFATDSDRALIAMTEAAIPETRLGNAA